MKSWVLATLGLFITLSCSILHSKTVKQDDAVYLGFYNVENLFDTIDNPHTNDNEFLPTGKKNWNGKRLQLKMEKLDSVLKIMTPNGVPDILGVCEIENKQVCIDWKKQGVLINHEIVHQESPDHRGIDVALFYNPSKFTLISSNWYQVVMDNQEKSSTREILYCRLGFKADTLHVFVNHWPSRYGGEEKSRPKRAKAAGVLKHVVDSIQSVHPNSKIIITGDFNDHPTNESLTNVLAVDTVITGNKKLFNLSYQKEKENLGSYNYRGDWGCLDQMIVSKYLMETNRGLSCSAEAYEIIQQPFMMYTNKQGKTSPFRTYGGPNYYGGFSDHLPVVIKLNYH